MAMMAQVQAMRPSRAAFENRPASNESSDLTAKETDKIMFDPLCELCFAPTNVGPIQRAGNDSLE